MKYALFGPQQPPKISSQCHTFTHGLVTPHLTSIFFSFYLLLWTPLTTNHKMAPQLSEDEIDDLLYAARTGDQDELTTLLSSLAKRENVSPAEILISAKDEGKSTCLHMATGNGHLGESLCVWFSHCPRFLASFHEPPHHQEKSHNPTPPPY